MPDEYVTHQAPDAGATFQEATNRVLTGTALAAHASGETVTLYSPPPPPPPPSGPPTETGAVQWPVTETDTDIPLVAASATIVVGGVFLIDYEYMDVVDVSNPDNPGVTRGCYGSAAAAHAAGAAIAIWGAAGLAQSTAKKVTKQSAKSATPRDETKREETAREKLEDRQEEDREDAADERARGKKK